MARRTRRRGSDLSRRQHQSIVNAVMAGLALTMLLVFWRQLSDGAAGCFYGLTASEETQIRRDHHDATPETRVKSQPKEPQFRVRVEPLEAPVTKEKNDMIDAK